jgi:hypothetical protein
MSDIAAFLGARLNEDEATAKATEHEDGPYTLSWTRGGGRRLTFDNGRHEDYEAVYAGNWERILIARDSVRGGPLATHIALHDPARALREAEVWRKVLGEHHPTDWTAYGDRMCSRCVWDMDELADPDAVIWIPWPCPTIRAVAAIWSDNPDYDEAWRLP